jgi:hypothetical protein
MGMPVSGGTEEDATGPRYTRDKSASAGTIVVRACLYVWELGDHLVEPHTMRSVCLCVGAVLVMGTLLSGSARAQERSTDVRSWTVYIDPTTGTRVDLPEGLFVPVGPPQRGRGQRFRTRDGRAEFSIYKLDGARGETPRSYLQNNLKVPQRALGYQRVTRKFFAISALDKGRIFYSRCNFAAGRASSMHCIYLAYPAQEKKAWDGVVTRISLSLRPRSG